VAQAPDERASRAVGVALTVVSRPASPRAERTPDVDVVRIVGGGSTIGIRPEVPTVTPSCRSVLSEFRSISSSSLGPESSVSIGIDRNSATTAKTAEVSTTSTTRDGSGVLTERFRPSSPWSTTPCVPVTTADRVLLPLVGALSGGAQQPTGHRAGDPVVDIRQASPPVLDRFRNVEVSPYVSDRRGTTSGNRDDVTLELRWDLLGHGSTMIPSRLLANVMMSAKPGADQTIKSPPGTTMKTHV